VTARYDAVILGAGAAGLYAAGIAAQRGLSVLLLDHAKAPGEKIRISGGGRCNFTNLNAGPQAFISANPHFAKSALARHTAQDFIALIRRHGIAFHEKTLGQLFCDGSARQVVAMLVAELAGAELRLSTEIGAIAHDGSRFRVALPGGAVETPNLILATGGKSIPKMGATGLAYRIAAQFGLAVTETRPALVPLTFDTAALAWIAPLAGIALPVAAQAGARAPRFEEAALFTHRGLSGPAVLQVSSYWREGDSVTLDLLPALGRSGTLDWLRARKAAAGSRAPATILAEKLPARLAATLAQQHLRPVSMAEHSDADLSALTALLTALPLTPAGSEGYRTAEVTLGGVATDALDARTMQARAVPGLHVIGEAVDVTGWLGGYNFQWAWSSAHACATGLTAAG
jgi:predicted Rossmann fold flavoprotein